MVLAEARGDAVVEHHAVLAQHQAVAAAADGELAPGVGVDAVQELGGVRPLEVDLAERRGIEDADRRPCCLDLARDRFVHVLAGAGIVPGALPLADGLEDRAVGRVPGVHRRAPDRVEQGAGVAPDDRAEGDRRVGRAEGGDAELGNALAGDLRDDAERVDVAGLALVGAHAGRGVALDVLDRAVALPERQREVGGGDVVLQIDERFSPRRRQACRNLPDQPGRRFLGLVEAGKVGQRRLEPGRRSCGHAGARSLLETGVQAEGAVAGAGRALRLERLARQEDAAPGIVAGPGA